MDEGDDKYNRHPNYFTYEVRQFSSYVPNGDPKRHAKPPRRFFPVPRDPNEQFMPTWLVRTSDLQLVRGCTVNEEYCTLSYSWNQSGENIVDKETGKSKRVDNGKHEIIYPARTIRRSPRGRKRLARQLKLVKFEQLIQQICKDFNVKYIWFDQMCINQNDKEEKKREIKQMHRIYSNAYCTLILMPELQMSALYYKKKWREHLVDFEKILGSQWMKRMWTLEEALLSPKLLFVGRDVHAWWYVQREFSVIRDICQRPARWNVNTVLRYAHIRTSTKAHDHVFALANIFSDLMNNISVSYDQPALDVMVQFYGLLAMKNLNILCFRKPQGGFALGDDDVGGLGFSEQTQWYHDVPIRKFDLPSWTGIAGEHLQDPSLKTSFTNYSISGRSLQVTCSALTMSDDTIREINSSTEAGQDGDGYYDVDEDVDAVPEGAFKLSLTIERHDQEESMELELLSEFPPRPHYDSCLAVSVRLPGHGGQNKGVKKTMLLRTIGNGRPDDEDIILSAADELLFLSHFFPIKTVVLFWWDLSSPSKEFASIDRFSQHLTEEFDGPDQCAILTGIHFTSDSKKNTDLYPFIKKEGDHYKAVGVCDIENPEYLFFGCTIPEQTFVIR
ncbi:heterokaryon incompatibility protein-domain-containing protein [Zychaea mexicana]|uniref:heterokaryon incompatibility protein-domain-containing protein n=1 Tax=Zychaea mexicana TaxID=64656 RepID=UPI0022FEA6BF|nr:heterokaryon incompatibility protein-domain-containing protein [Zychaea mexicana]KAI9495630.1 heterokaryon incompatibility protein-domain-containing protein [Zychaea mexicana]